MVPLFYGSGTMQTQDPVYASPTVELGIQRTNWEVSLFNRGEGEAGSGDTIQSLPWESLTASCWVASTRTCTEYCVDVRYEDEATWRSSQPDGTGTDMELGMTGSIREFGFDACG